jgi:hypothetical protein
MLLGAAMASGMAQILPKKGMWRGPGVPFQPAAACTADPRSCNSARFARLDRSLWFERQRHLLRSVPKRRLSSGMHPDRIINRPA